MRVSEYYDLKLTQPSLEFLDVDIINDTRLFVDPQAVRDLNSEFGDHCKDLIQDFFNELLQSIKHKKNGRAQYLLSSLREPNETHLGLSKGRSKGRGLGPEKAREIFLSFSRSKAVETGLLEDLEDTVLLIEGISLDILSDIVTNIIRGPLIHYTQQICREYEIPMAKEISSGPVWNLKTKKWDIDYVELPEPDGEKLILLPKSIIRLTGCYNVSQYYRHYVLEKLKEEEIENNTSLVEIIKTGKNKGSKRVYKNALEAKYGTQEKTVSIQKTNEFPDLIKKYKEENSAPTPAPSHQELSSLMGTPPPNWKALLSDVTKLNPGKKQAYQYEDAILSLMKALFYPALVDPQAQTPIHNGLKRVDITFTNYAKTGFFDWLNRNYNCPYIFVECKNFGEELGNPEIDQIAMRLSKTRGQFGLILCRSIEDPTRLLDRCRAALKDKECYIVVLDDTDLEDLVSEAEKQFPPLGDFETLKRKFKELVF